MNRRQALRFLAAAPVAAAVLPLEALARTYHTGGVVKAGAAIHIHTGGFEVYPQFRKHVEELVRKGHAFGNTVRVHLGASAEEVAWSRGVDPAGMPPELREAELARARLRRA